MIGLIILGLLVILIAVILIRTLMFTPKKEESFEPINVDIDRDAAVHALAELVKCKTISYDDRSLEDLSEFEKLYEKLPVLFPNVMKTCELKKFDGRGLLFKWKGRESKGDPAVLMAHFDVVPIEEEHWTKPAFDAVIEDGIMWGRGTVDTKNTFSGILSAAENLIKQGFTPSNDIYFAFSGQEEIITGTGAKNIVAYFEKEKIVPSLVVDEGGAVVSDVFPGVNAQCGMIGIAEKGILDMEFTVNSRGGHASAPGPHTPVGELSAACAKLEAHPFKAHYTKPILEMFDNLGRHSTFVYRMIFANIWLFKPVLNKICEKSGGTLNALIRTTVAFTQMSGSKAPNVIPPTASMVANLRLNPEDSSESAIAYAKKIINNDNISIAAYDVTEPSRISRTDVEGWKIVKRAVADTWKGSIVTPYLMMQCSDSRFWGKISDRIYKFSAADLTSEEIASIHGNDEHLRVEVIGRAVEFFYRIMKQC